MHPSTRHSSSRRMPEGGTPYSLAGSIHACLPITSFPTVQDTTTSTSVTISSSTWTREAFHHTVQQRMFELPRKSSVELCKISLHTGHRRIRLNPLTWLLDYSDPTKHPLLYKSFSFGKHKDVPMNHSPARVSTLGCIRTESWQDPSVPNTAWEALQGVYHPSLTKGT